ncbi:T9SS type A sorting domain-containing protein [Hyunsoonleella aestuarii]|uniref:T9SS type A sorting domain-containing protein n=1 Tax=Hyunsoonleella aestuarii TaxID=912802 RepID=UPI0011112751
MIVVNESLSTESFNSTEFQYFPNPVNKNLIIKSQKLIDHLTVYNIFGQRIITKSPNTKIEKLDFIGLNQGVYFVEVTINDLTKIIKIIKRD